MKQKAINLDQNKIRALFPRLADAANTAKFPVQVNWFFNGENSKELVQNVTLNQKNWRLNSMPWVDHDVEVGDIIVCQMLGDEAPPQLRLPTGIALALVRPGDEGFDWFDQRLPSLQARDRGGFITLDDGELLGALDWRPESAVWQLTDFLTRGLAELVEDVVAGADVDAVPEIGLRSIERTGTTRDAVEKLSRLRAAIGLGGETLVDAVLERMTDCGEIVSYEWVSASNATAPVDFRAEEQDRRLSIEVKTTKGAHAVGFIISVAELREAVAAVPYEIWRVSEFRVVDDEIAGTIRRGDPAPLVEATLEWLNTAPEGVKVPSVELAPSQLAWSVDEPVACSVSRIPNEHWMAEFDLAAS